MVATAEQYQEISKRGNALRFLHPSLAFASPRVPWLAEKSAESWKSVDHFVSLNLKFIPMHLDGENSYSQTFTCDSLNRLTAATRGGASYQSWGLDAQGNWVSFTSNGSTQTRTANAQNQITSVSGLLSPEYDANGNMVSDQNGDTLVYDAWNRLVKVTNASGQVIAQYTYNAQGWRISETYPVAAPGIPAGTTKYFYYSSQWQVVEERWNGTATSNVQYQYVWSAAYVNGMVLRDTYVAGAVQPDLRIYTQTDADWNVTALVGYNPATQTWGVVERFVYSPYGTATILSSSWAPQADAFDWQYMYQGGQQDSATGLYIFQHRNYSPALGAWVSQDPLLYSGGANAYQFAGGSPVGAVDPAGTQYMISPVVFVPNIESYYVDEMIGQANAWQSQGDLFAALAMSDFANNLFRGGNAGAAFQRFAPEIKASTIYRRAAEKYFAKVAASIGKDGPHHLPALIPPPGFPVYFTPSLEALALNYLFGTHVSDLGVALGTGHFGYTSAVMVITGCPGHQKWTVHADMEERNPYHFTNSPTDNMNPVYHAGYLLQTKYGHTPFLQSITWGDKFSGRLGGP